MHPLDRRTPTPSPEDSSTDFVPRLSLVDRTADHLRQGIASGKWKTRLPGALKLAKEIGVSRTTLVAATTRLVEEGLLKSAGEREPFSIVGVPRDGEAKTSRFRPLRVGFLLMEALENVHPATQRIIMHIFAQLKGDGHVVNLVSMPAGKDSHKTGYLPRLTREHESDAWIVLYGTQTVLEWLTAQGLPTFAFGGRWMDLPVASIATFDVAEALRVITRTLLAQGHRRIVFLSSHSSRQPEPEPLLLAFRDELLAARIKAGDYNTPDWVETPQGLNELMESLFRFTPPSAVICHNLRSAAGVLAFLARQRLRIPEDISVASFARPDTTAEWSFPGMRLAHIEGDDEAVYRTIREWVYGIAVGRIGRERMTGGFRLEPGNSIGPAKKPEEPPPGAKPPAGT